LRKSFGKVIHRPPPPPPPTKNPTPTFVFKCKKTIFFYFFFSSLWGGGVGFFGGGGGGGGGGESLSQKIFSTCPIFYKTVEQIQFLKDHCMLSFINFDAVPPAPRPVRLCLYRLTRKQHTEIALKRVKLICLEICYFNSQTVATEKRLVLIIKLCTSRKKRSWHRNLQTEHCTIKKFSFLASLLDMTMFNQEY